MTDTMSVIMPNGDRLDGVPAGTPKADIMAKWQASQVPEPKPGVMERVKNAVIAPVGERDPDLKTAVIEGIKGIPAEIGHQFMDAAHSFKEHIAPSTVEGIKDSAPIGGIVPREALDAVTAIMSPITGTLTSAVGRPVEQMTSVRRNIVGDVASAFVPLGAAGDAGKVGGELINGERFHMGTLTGKPLQNAKIYLENNPGTNVLPAGVTKINEAPKPPPTTIKPTAADAHAAGYVLPPKMISEKPGIVANVLSGMSGKIKTAQAAAEKNQVVTNALATKSLGLPPDAELIGDTFKNIRAEAGKSYEAVKTAIPTLEADEPYLETVKSLGGQNSDAAAHFPKTMNNQGIKDLVGELASVKSFPTTAGMELVKELRSSAVANLKTIGDRSAHALGLAQRQAADAVDALIERNIEKAGGDANLVNDYKAARQRIAKSYDVEAVTNPATGDVNALGLARLAGKGKPLTGELQTIAKTAQAFPKAMQAGVSSEPLSALDFFGAAALAAHGNPKLAGMMLARPVARATVLSPMAQERLVTKASGAAPSVQLPIRRAPAINALSQLSQQGQNP